jgi:hypothetical protein
MVKIRMHRLLRFAMLRVAVAQRPLRMAKLWMAQKLLRVAMKLQGLLESPI